MDRHSTLGCGYRQQVNERVCCVPVELCLENHAAGLQAVACGSLTWTTNDSARSSNVLVFALPHPTILRYQLHVYNSAQFPHCLPRDSLRFHGFRAPSHRLPSTSEAHCKPRWFPELPTNRLNQRFPYPLLGFD